MKSLKNTAGTVRRRTVLLASAGAALIAAAIAPAHATNYQLTSTIAIPSAMSNAAGTFVGYDLSVFDPTSQLYYLTDRSNDGIDVFSSKTNSFVERIGSGLFAGNTASLNNAGPNGISISNVGSGKLLIAGDGPSTFQTFLLGTDGLTVLAGPRTTSTAVSGTPNPPNRVDGVAYSPTANTILAANNAANPGFVTLVDNGTGNVIKSILLNGTNGYPNVNGNGVEAVVYNTARKSFFVAVPQFNNTGAGGVIELDATTGALLNIFDFNALGLVGGCGPTGMAQGKGAAMIVACGDMVTAQSILLDPAAGTIKTETGAAGGDQASFNPTTNTFFLADRYQAGGPSLGVISGDGTFLQNVPITYNDHSVAVDPISGEVFVAFGASATGNPDPYCAAGCIGVFTNVPEPGTLPIMAAALVTLGVVARRRRRD